MRVLCARRPLRLESERGLCLCDEPRQEDCHRQAGDTQENAA